VTSVDVDTPAAQGADARGIAAFLDAIERDPRIEPHGLVIQRHGRRIAEGYWTPHTGDRSRLVYSLSKSFTGTALGLQVGEGRLSLDDLVSDHLPELFDADTDERTRRMTIRHIASMATGHDREMILEATAADPDDPVHGLFTIAPDAEPGTLFAYNQPPVLALATILQRLAGESLVGYLRPRVLDPLGIRDVRWARTPTGVDLGYSGVHTNLDAIARLGQLYLDDGTWRGRRLLPEGWVADASSVQVPNPQREEPDWRQGYGFQLWMSRHGYRGDGAFGQYMVVLPEYDAVVAMFSCVEVMQIVLDAMWEHLLPAMGDDELAPSADDDALAERLATLALPTASERLGGDAPGVAAATFVRADGGPSHPTVTAIDATDTRMIVHEGETSFEVPLTAEWTVTDDWIATSATRLADGRLAVDLVLLATPHRMEIELDPTGGTFVARWPIVPLFGAGLGTRLASMRPPD
jgi:CubicO group peptidase (beta-lactamase class C family)